MNDTNASATSGSAHERAQGLGASDMAAVLGARGTYRRPYEIWLEKTGQTPGAGGPNAAGADPDAGKPLDLFGVGNAFEPAVVLYGDRVARSLAPDPPALATGYTPAFRRHANGIVQGHADWLIPGTAVVEGKVVVHGAAPEGAKLQWEMQVRTYLALFDVPFAILSMLDIPERLPTETVGLLYRLAHEGDAAALLAAIERVKWAKLTHVVYRRDMQVEALMLSRAVAWWERHVVGGEPPPPDGTKAATRHLLASNPPPEAEAKTIRRADDLEAVALAYVDAARREKEAAAEKEVAGQQLMEAIGADHGVRGTGWSATWSRWTKAGTDWTRLREERPDVVAVLDEYKTEAPAGRLYVKRNGPLRPFANTNAKK